MSHWPSSEILSQTNSAHLKQSNSKFTIAIKTRLTPNIQPSVRKTNAVIKSFWAVSFYSLLLLGGFLFLFFFILCPPRSVTTQKCLLVYVYLCMYPFMRVPTDGGCRLSPLYIPVGSVSQSPVRSCFSSHPSFVRCSPFQILVNIFVFTNTVDVYNRIKKQTMRTWLIGVEVLV